MRNLLKYYGKRLTGLTAGNYADVYGVNNIIRDNFCSRYAARSNTYIESANATLTLENCLTTDNFSSGDLIPYDIKGNHNTSK